MWSRDVVTKAEESSVLSEINTKEINTSNPLIFREYASLMLTATMKRGICGKIFSIYITVVILVGCRRHCDDSRKKVEI